MGRRELHASDALDLARISAQYLEGRVPEQELRDALQRAESRAGHEGLTNYATWVVHHWLTHDEALAETSRTLARDAPTAAAAAAALRGVVRASAAARRSGYKPASSRNGFVDWDAIAAALRA